MNSAKTLHKLYHTQKVIFVGIFYKNTHTTTKQRRNVIFYIRRYFVFTRVSLISCYRRIHNPKNSRKRKEIPIWLISAHPFNLQSTVDVLSDRRQTWSQNGSTQIFFFIHAKTFPILSIHKTLQSDIFMQRILEINTPSTNSSRTVERKT